MEQQTDAAAPVLNLDWSKLGHISMEKGFIGEKPLIVWDGIQECNGEQCGIYDRCNSKVKNYANGKCKIMKEYISSLLFAIDKSYKGLDEVQMIKIGFQIVPLYSQLCRLKMIEMTVRDIVYSTEKGSQLVHPVFKEIREVLKAIHIMWKDVQMPPPNVPDPAVRSKPTEGKVLETKGTGDQVEGDRTHIERITARQIDRKGVIR